MKKIALIIITFMLFVSCNASIRLLDEDGFRIFQCGWSLNEEECIIQTHEGYVANGFFYQERIFEMPVVIKNPVAHDIQIKVTKRGYAEWLKVPKSSEIEISL
jgi:hypothetical protein